jgi:hypothetical protein
VKTNEISTFPARLSSSKGCLVLHNAIVFWSNYTTVYWMLVNLLLINNVSFGKATRSAASSLDAQIISRTSAIGGS